MSARDQTQVSELVQQVLYQLSLSLSAYKYIS